MTGQQVTHGASSIQEASAEALAAVRAWPSEAAHAWTNNALRQAERDAAVQAIVVSGSAIRDVAQSDDLDLVLVYQGRRVSLPRPPIDVDLRQYEQDEVARRLQAGHDYLASVVRHGRALFERDGWWSRLRAGWDGRLSLPSGADARARARDTERRCEEMQAVGDLDAAAELRLSTLTHLARAVLSDAGVFPQSRPELVDQLRGVGEGSLADRLADALARRYG